MPFNGSGSFSPYTPGNPAVSGTTISSTAFNNTVTDFAAGLSNAMTRDGQSPATANIPMGGKKITGLGDGTATTDAATFGQAGQLGVYLPAGTGAVATTLQETLRKRFILADDFISTANTAAQNVTGWAALVTYVNTLANGAHVQVSRGTYLFNGPIAVTKKMLLVGEGRQSTIFSFSNAGDGIQSTWPINSGTGVWVGVRDLAIINTNGANTGGGFVDVGGSFVDLDNIYVSGFKYGVIFDQTEIASIDRSEIVTPASGVGVWLVNGADHTVGATANYTNRISITRNQFNANASAVANILDDGGGNHSIRDNNWNAGNYGLRAAGVYCLVVSGNESEIHTTSDIYLVDTTNAGAYVGPCSAFDISGNELISPYGYNIGIQHAVNGRIVSNLFGQATSGINFMNGASNASSGVIIEGNSKILSGVGITAGPFVAGFSRSLRQNIIRQVAATYSSAISAAGAVTITPASMEAIHVGSRLTIINADGTNYEDVLVTSTTGTTFNTTLASTKAVNFQIYGATPYDQEQGVWTPTLYGSGTAGTNTYSVQVGTWSRRGNQVHVKGTISITAMPVGMVGGLNIGGLPFTAENVTNASASCVMSAWTGFTFAANYTNMAGNLSANTNFVPLLRFGSGVGYTPVQNTDIPGTTCSLSFEMTYYTSSL